VTEEQNRSDAAVIIQRNYRGHRTRRAMEGRSLDPSVRWIEALRDGEFAFMDRGTLETLG
jgi:hypothetical protein